MLLGFGKGIYFIALIFSVSGESSFLVLWVLAILAWSLQNHTWPYLVSNQTFKFCLGLAQCECLIDLGSISTVWYCLGYSLPPHNPLLFPWCPIGKLHLHYVSHKVNTSSQSLPKDVKNTSSFDDSLFIYISQ